MNDLERAARNLLDNLLEDDDGIQTQRIGNEYLDALRAALDARGMVRRPPTSVRWLSLMMPDSATFNASTGAEA